VNVDSSLAAAVLIIHLLFIAWVIFGAALTRGHRSLTWIHIASLIYVFLVHYLEILVYPEVSELLLFWCAVGVGLINLAIYAARARSRSRNRAFRPV